MIQIAAICAISGCTTVAQKDWSLAPLPTEQELDEQDILRLTQTEINTGSQGFDAISGRILEILLVAHAEMLKNHAARCESEPLTRHLFLYNEFEDVVRVKTVPRLVPDRWSPPPDDPEIFDERYVFDFIPNSRGLDGCGILFVIDKSSKKVIETTVIR